MELKKTSLRVKVSRVYLLAMEAFLGKLLVVAGGAVDVIALSQEALSADGLLAVIAGETLLMPHLVLILHIL